MNNMLVVIDMINGFVKYGNLADSNIERIIPNVVIAIKSFLSCQCDVVAFRDCHDVNDAEFSKYPKHCIKGSDECKLIEELAPFKKNIIDIEKTTTNGFYTKKFAKLLAKKVYDNIFVCGCCTDICVSNFIFSLQDYITFNSLKTKILVIENAVDTFNAPNHDADEINKNELNKFIANSIYLCKITGSHQRLNEDIK